MFDADYFLQRLPKRIESMEDMPLVTVYLVTGEHFNIYGIDDVTEGYVLLRAYPEDMKHFMVAMKEAKEIGESAPFDRVDIAYEVISCVALTLPPIESGQPRLGFGRWDGH